MSQAVSPATGRAYGLARVTRVWHLSRATVYRHRAAPAAATPTGPARRGPVGACADPSCSSMSAPRSSARACMARATARSGPGCAMPASAPQPGGSGA